MQWVYIGVFVRFFERRFAFNVKILFSLLFYKMFWTNNAYRFDIWNALIICTGCIWFREVETPESVRLGGPDVRKIDGTANLIMPVLTNFFPD